MPPIHLSLVDEPSADAIDASSPNSLPTLVGLFGRPAAMVLHDLTGRLRRGDGRTVDVATLAAALGLTTAETVGALGRLRLEGMVWPTEQGLAVRGNAVVRQAPESSPPSPR